MNDTVRVRRALLELYDRSARDLPWRGETDPYRILVSEVMLQQTRVETVQRYYGPWLERFPDLATLAAAGEDEVLKAWEGLGYYRRARRLHAVARLVRESGDEALPTEVDELRALPGIGEYTAGAVASIAYGVVTPAVDGNVRRVLARLFDEPDASPAWLRRTAAGLVDPRRPGDWNQALMELGATVCTPRGPDCSKCPLARWCGARAAGTIEQRPRPRTRKALRRRHYLLGVFHNEGRLLLERRSPEGLLGGMWALPEVVLKGAPEEEGAGAGRSLALARKLGLETRSAVSRLPRHEHRFTHLHAVYLPWSVEVTERVAAADRLWVDPRSADLPALPVAQRRVIGSFVSTPRTEAAGT